MTVLLECIDCLFQFSINAWILLFSSTLFHYEPAKQAILVKAWESLFLSSTKRLERRETSSIVVTSQTKCSLGMHHDSHTLTGMKFFSAFYHTSDFSWLKVYFPIHYPTINVFIFPNMLALRLMLLVTHYAQNYASPCYLGIHTLQANNSYLIAI